MCCSSFLSTRLQFAIQSCESWELACYRGLDETFSLWWHSQQWPFGIVLFCLEYCIHHKISISFFFFGCDFVLQFCFSLLKPQIIWTIPYRKNIVQSFLFWTHLQDGTQVQFKSTKLQKYIAPENGGGSGSVVVVNRDSASGWETFRVCSSSQH